LQVSSQYISLLIINKSQYIIWLMAYSISRWE